MGWRKAGPGAVVAGIVLGIAASAQAGTITFSGLNIYNQSPIPDTTGDTVDVDVVYRQFNTSDGTTIVDYLGYWSTDYGDLVDVAGMYEFVYGEAMEISLVAAPGREVVLESFDVASWPNADLSAFIFRILDGAGNVLVDYAGAGGVTVHGAGPTHDHYTPNLRASTLRIQLGDRDFNTAFDNITFHAVPLPPAAAMGMGAMAVAAVAALRRRRSAKIA